MPENQRRRGCLDCHLIEPKPGKWKGQRCQRCRQARGILNPPRGKRTGRPRTRIMIQRDCEGCGQPFKYRSRSKRDNRFCGLKCRLAFLRTKRRKLPDDKTLRDLYLKKNLSTPQIAALYDTQPRTVGKMLAKIGVPMRRHTKPLICQHPGCQLRVQKLRHMINGSWYGTLCKLHWNEHRAELARDYRAGLPPRS
jgi:hypothetical protein